MPMTQDEPNPPNAVERFTKVVFAGMALGSVLTGLMVYLFHAAIGIGAETAQIISTAFLIVGIADTLVLYLWDRIFKRRA
jgi:hypothetical protein